MTGLAGRGIQASRTPWMHEQEADAQGLRLVYSLFDFDARGWGDKDLPALLDAAQRLGFAGLNITFPFKQAVMAHLDDLSDGAREVGAVNTVSFANGKRTGFNTDVSGFSEGFASGLAGAATAQVVQTGCGGAGAATAYALLSVGTGMLHLVDSDQDRAKALADTLCTRFGAGRAVVAADVVDAMRIADGLVNATPMGMAKFPGMPVPSAAIESRHWVADIVYFPLETALLSDAARKGCRTLNGSGMAVGQAADAFQIFTGRTPNRARMHTSFLDFVGARPVQAA
jgi:shikimate dehydrogenase